MHAALQAALNHVLSEDAVAPVAADVATRVHRHFHNRDRIQTYSTWFDCWDGRISAAHCVESAGGRWPYLPAGDHGVLRPNALDAALLGCEVPRERPAAPVPGQAVSVFGYPAGSRFLEARRGSVYARRYPGQWILKIDAPAEPVVVGMSGGPVIDDATGAVIGILITRNSPAQIDHDPENDESCDFVPLSAVWDALQAGASA